MTWTTETKLLAAGFVGAALTSCVLALQGVPTFPASLFAGAVGTFTLMPPKGGRFPRHYAWLAALGMGCALWTFAWQRTGS